MEKKVNKDPFGSGTEYDIWVARNCERCWKASRWEPERTMYTKSYCAIDRDIWTRMISSNPISQRTIDICRKRDCPFRQEKRPRKMYEKDKNEPKLFEE